jgi:hypothetical protein
MAIQQIEQGLVGGRQVVKIGFALALAALMALLTMRLASTAPAPGATLPAAAQPVVGRSVVMTGLRRRALYPCADRGRGAGAASDRA